MGFLHSAHRSSITLKISGWLSALVGLWSTKRGEKKGQLFPWPARADSDRYFYTSLIFTWSIQLPWYVFLFHLLLCYSSRKIFPQPCWFSFTPRESNPKGIFQQSTFLFEYHFIPVLRWLCSSTHGLCSTFLSNVVLFVFTPIRMNPTLESSIPGPGPASPALNHPDSGLASRQRRQLRVWLYRQKKSRLITPGARWIAWSRRTRAPLCSGLPTALTS